MDTNRLSKGLEVLRKLDPAGAETLLTRFQSSSPELARYAVEFGYGEIMSRGGLDLRTRELLNIAMLAGMGHAPMQLEMHLYSALRVGVSKDEIFEAVLQVAVYAGFPAAFNLLLAFEKVLTKNDGNEQEGASQ